MTDFESNYKILNPGQKQAVDTIEGPVLVIAGPGTGKTQVLAMRIANILLQADVSPHNILCLTFTESGVAAMRKRLQRIIGTAAYYVHIHTFHSFCNEVIQTFPDKFPELSGNPQQLDDLQRIKVIRQIIDGFSNDEKFELIPFANPYQYQYEIISNLQTLKREGVSPQKLAEVAGEEVRFLGDNPKLNRKGEPTIAYQRELRSAQRNVELAEIYASYEKTLAQEAYYDYEDMILFVLRRFEEDADLLAHYAEKFQYIHVDEYQDTNGAQNQVIKLLGSQDPENQPNIFAVGDDDQAIYRFQGANVDNLLFFEQQFKNVQVIPITINYRSSQAILNFAEGSIRHNQNRLVNLIDGLSKDLKAHKQDKNGGIKPQVYQFDTDAQENSFLVNKIQELHESGVDYNEIAILYRRHSDAEDVIDSLLRAKVPLQVAKGDNVLEERIVQQLLQLIRLVEFAPDQKETLLFEVLFYKFLQLEFEFTRLDAFELISKVNEHNYAAKSDGERLSLFAALADSPIKELRDKIVLWREIVANEGLSAFVTKLIEESGIFAHVFGTEINFDQATALNSFVNFVKDIQRGNPEATLTDLLQDINLLAENNIGVSSTNLETESDSVQLMTAHGAKGLEYEHVFIIKTYHKNWGGRVSRRIIKLPEHLFDLVADQQQIDEKQLELEDDRRLFFVAATRAKTSLYIISASEYTSAGNTKEVEPSQFVTELDESVYQQPIIAESSEQKVVQLQRNLSSLPEINYSDQEKEFLATLVAKFRLSASALNEYIECPLKFKFNRLLRVPIPPNEHISLGNAVHKAMEQYGKKLINQGKSGSSNDIGYVLEKFEQALEHELLGKDMFERILTEGTEILKTYFQTYSEFKVPTAVEYNFNRHHVVMELDGQDPVVLSGKIDKIDWVDEQTNRIKITDYKTSKPKSENHIRGNTKAADRSIWRQLVFYKLMGDLDEYFRAPNKMSKYIIDHVEIDFLKADNSRLKRVAISITDDEVSEVKAEIADVIQNIRNLNFTGTEDYPLCGECEYCQLLST